MPLPIVPAPITATGTLRGSGAAGWFIVPRGSPILSLTFSVLRGRFTGWSVFQQG
jgi:hypothetical protein